MYSCTTKIVFFSLFSLFCLAKSFFSPYFLSFPLLPPSFLEEKSNIRSDSYSLYKAMFLLLVLCFAIAMSRIEEHADIQDHTTMHQQHPVVLQIGRGVAKSDACCPAVYACRLSGCATAIEETTGREKQRSWTTLALFLPYTAGCLKQPIYKV